MPRPRNPDKERLEWDDLPGYVAPRYRPGARPYAYHFCRGRRKASGIPWSTDKKKLLYLAHKQWTDDLLLEEMGLTRKPDPIDMTRPRSLLEAVKSFYDTSAHRLTENAVRKLRQAISAHFPTDVTLDYDAIHDTLTKSLKTTEYSTSTVRKHLLQIRRVLQYCVDREWLNRNPVDIIGVPVEPMPDQVHVFSRAEVNAIVHHLRTKSKSPYRDWLALFFEWMSLTAMRPREILSMKWTDLRPDEIDIPTSKTDKPRSIPLVPLTDLEDRPERQVWQSRLQSMVDELKSLGQRREEMLQANGKGTSWKVDHVWPWSEVKNLRKAWVATLEALGLPYEKMYRLRASAEDYWVWELKFDMETVCELAGHSPAIYIKHYRRRYGSADRQRMITG